MTSILEVYRRWPDHAACIKHLETVRWGESPAARYAKSERGKATRKAAAAARYNANPEKAKADHKRRLFARETRDTLRAFAQRLRRSLLKRCRQRGFDIPVELKELDFYLSELGRHVVDGKPACQCCHTPFLLDPQAPLATDRSPSCDRVDPTKPTYRDNIVIICWRCNRIKQDATAAELISIGSWLLSRGGA